MLKQTKKKEKGIVKMHIFIPKIEGKYRGIVTPLHHYLDLVGFLTDG